MSNVFANGTDSEAAYILAKAMSILNDMECHDAVGEIAMAIEAYSADYARPAEAKWDQYANRFYIEFAE